MSPVFLSWAFPPASYPRAIQVARLVKFLGADVDVVCADSDVRDEDLVALLAGDRVDVTTVADPPAAAVARLARRAVLRERMQLPDAQRAWARRAVPDLVRHLGEGDRVLVTFGQPMSDHLAGVRVKRATGVPWIAHFSDPWVDNPLRRQGRLVQQLNRRLERAVVEACDVAVFTCQETADVVMSKYPASWRPKATVLPHAFDAELFPPVQPSPNLTVRSLGNFYLERTPAPLLSGLERLRRRRPEALDGVTVELVGSVPGARSLPEDLVTVRPPVPYLESLRLMREASVLVNVDAPADAGLFFPSKVAEYVGARRPIVALSPPGPAARVVADAGGWVARPSDADAVADALERGIDEARRLAGADWRAAGDDHPCAGARVGAAMAAVIDAVRR